MERHVFRAFGKARPILWQCVPLCATLEMETHRVRYGFLLGEDGEDKPLVFDKQSFRGFGMNPHGSILD